MISLCITSTKSVCCEYQKYSFLQRGWIQTKCFSQQNRISWIYHGSAQITNTDTFAVFVTFFVLWPLSLWILLKLEKQFPAFSFKLLSMNKLLDRYQSKQLTNHSSSRPQYNCEPSPTNSQYLMSSLFWAKESFCVVPKTVLVIVSKIL